MHFSDRWTELSAWIGILFIFIIPCLGWGLAYIILAKIKGKKPLIILTVLGAALIQVASPYYQFLYLSPPSEVDGQWGYAFALVVLFLLMFITLLIRQIGIAWLNDDKKIKEWLEITDGSNTHFLTKKLMKAFAFLMVAVNYVFFIGVTVLLASVFFLNGNYNYGLTIMFVSGVYLLIHMFVLRYFPFFWCKHCRRFLLEVDKKNNYLNHLKNVVFKSEFECMYCHAHYYFSQSDLEAAIAEEKKVNNSDENNTKQS